MTEDNRPEGYFAKTVWDSVMSHKQLIEDLKVSDEEVIFMEHLCMSGPFHDTTSVRVSSEDLPFRPQNDDRRKQLEQVVWDTQHVAKFVIVSMSFPRRFKNAMSRVKKGEVQQSS